MHSILCVPPDKLLSGSARCNAQVQDRHSARSLGKPVHLSFRLSLARRQEALPSSRVIPMSTCPGLRPRRCPECLPVRKCFTLPLSNRIQDCCLPRAFKPSAFSGNYLIILMTATIHISMLNFAACTLATPSFAPPSLASTWVRYCPAG